MDEKQEDKLEVEIREHLDADFFPEKCPSCGCEEINRKIDRNMVSVYLKINRCYTLFTP